MSGGGAGALPDIGVRALSAADVPAVAALAAGVPTAPHWPAVEFLRLARVAAEEPQRRGAWVAMAGDAVCGFAIARGAAGEAELESIVTAPEYLRRGVGSALLRQVFNWARGIGAGSLLLECRASNRAALRLYAGFGFHEEGRRRNYYGNPTEDAVLMRCALP